MTDNTEIYWKVMKLLTGGENLDQSLTDSLELVRRESGAEEATLWLTDLQENKNHAIIHSGKSSVAGYSTDAGEGIVGKVCKTGEPMMIPDTAGNPDFPNGNDAVTGVRTRNAYYMPLQLPQQTIGCLQLVNHPDGDWSGDLLKILKVFCGLTAMVIDEKGYSFAPAVHRKAILSLRDVKKEFKTGSETVQVLKGINLEILENEFLVILGESGCGKSTLLNIIGGMDSMTSGTLLMEDRDFSHPTEKELTDYRRDYIGFIFQAYNLMPNLTALENIEFIAENCPSHGDPKAALAVVGLTDRAGNYPSMMSGGQQQRVSIARAIVKNPRLILADEPTAALDYATSIDVLKVIEKLVKEQHTTVVMVTHNVEIAKMADRVVRLKNGKIVSIRINSWPAAAESLEW